MTPAKAKRIGIIVVSIFTIIHSFFYILAISNKADYVTITDGLYLLDTVVLFSILSTILFGKKVGDKMIINYQDEDDISYGRNILALTTTIVFILHSLTFSFDFLKLCFVNYLATYLTFTIADGIFYLFRRMLRKVKQ